MTTAQMIQAAIVRADLLICRVVALWPTIAGIVTAAVIAVCVHRIRSPTGRGTADTKRIGGYTDGT